MDKTPFRVFVQKRRGRPIPVATAMVDTIPATWEHEGQVWHFVTADLTARTITYSPSWQPRRPPMAPDTAGSPGQDRITGSAATLSHTAWATPYSLKERQRHGLPPRAVMHVGYPYGKQMRMVAVELDRTALLKVIANAADALRLLDEAPDA